MRLTQTPKVVVGPLKEAVPMPLNMGIVDRCVRTCLVAPGLVLSSWIVFGFGSVVGIVFLVVAGIMLATSAVGFCPTYTLFGINTNRAGTATPTRSVGVATGRFEQDDARRPAGIHDETVEPERTEQLTHTA